MQGERGNKHWKTFVKLTDEPTSSAKYTSEPMSEIATVVYLILPA